MQHGFTFSPQQVMQLGMPIVDTWQELMNWPPSIIRLGTYWPQLQPIEHQYNFESLEILLNMAEKSQHQIVLTLGVKAPRWPEFYYPGFVPKDPTNNYTQTMLLQYLRKLITYTRSYKCIVGWQVENEPFDKSGKYEQKIPLSLWQSEFELLRKLDDRPIVVNYWGNNFVKDVDALAAAQLADIAGLDLYYQQFIGNWFGRSWYAAPAGQRQLRRRLQQLNKPIWITELQAEPWEQNFTQFTQLPPKHFSLLKWQNNYQQALQFNPQVILFWGVEYWLWHKMHGNNQFVNFYHELTT